MMHKNLIIFIIVLAISKTIGKSNKTVKVQHFEKGIKERDKRSIHDDDKLFWSNSKFLPLIDDSKLVDIKMQNIEKNSKFHDYDLDAPFWGTRGRRSSEENFESEYPLLINDKHKCAKLQSFNDKEELFKMNRNNRDDIPELFWANRGRRQDNDPQFWDSRGRRDSFLIPESKDKPVINALWNSDSNVDENEPFWGNRGRREENEPFWGNRGRREENEPFWGNRGRREENEPFWGNRGRRQDSDPFWGNRGRRDDILPFWGNRGRRQENDPFWGNRGRRNENFRKYILNAIDNNQDDNIVNSIPTNKRDDYSFWNNRGRESKLKNLFSGYSRLRSQFMPPVHNKGKDYELQKASEARAMHDDRIYAEQPHYILVERSSRSSGEDDPYFISRGKKKTHNYVINKAIRSRRGSLEELVKSVRNDPYFLARGKKEDGKIGNNTLYEEFIKGKELICATIELLAIKNGKMKRETDERDRRTILKKLAAQLQNDPFFVSRGKKNVNGDLSEQNLNEFINHVADMCN